VRLRLENASGIVYSTSVPANEVSNVLGVMFRVEDFSARDAGGIGAMRIIKRKRRASGITLRVFGDLSAATQSHMRFVLTIGEEEFTTEGDWQKLPNGWRVGSLRLDE